MSRTVLAVMAGLLCALAGLKYAQSLKSEAVRLSRWEELLEHLSLLLEEGSLPLPQILCAAAELHRQPDLLLREVAASLQQEPLTPLATVFGQLCPDWREKTVLQRMFSRLGHGSRESRHLAVTQCSREIRLLAQRASAAAEKDVKPWQTLGLIGGLCLTILLL